MPSPTFQNTQSVWQKTADAPQVDGPLTAAAAQTCASSARGSPVQGRGNPWTELYDPARKMLRSAGTFVSENVNVAALSGGATVQ